MKKLFYIILVCNLLFYSFSPSKKKVYTSIEEALKEPDKVEILKLNKKKLNDFPIEILTLKNLTHLDLSRNKIAHIPADIKELKSLEILNLSKNEFHRFPTEVTYIEGLRELNLSKSDIREVPNEIKYLKKLKRLDIWDSELEIISDSIQNLKELEILDLRLTFLDKSDYSKMKSLLPNTQIRLSASCDCAK